MYPVSDAFARQLLRSHQVASKVEILDRGTVLATLETTIDGSVKADRSEIQRSAEVTFADVDGLLTPGAVDDLLAPFGNDIRPYRGVVLPDGTVEYVPLGTLRITKMSSEWPSVTVTAMDYAYVIQQARFEEPYQIVEGTNYITALGDLLSTRYSGISTNFPTTSSTTPNIVYETQSDPWADAAQRIAESLGKRLYFDQFGVCQLADEPQATADAVVWEYAEAADGVLLSLSKDWDAEGHYNAVIATGEPVDETPPVRAVAVDDDPASPTYFYGRYGKRPRFYTSPLITTEAQAESAALSLLWKELGISQSVTFTAMVNPAHEIGDVVYMARPASYVDAYHILDSFTIPLRGSEPMAASTRATLVAV